MKFFLIIGRNALYIYEKNGQKFERQFIEGSDKVIIDSNNIVENVNSFMETLADEKNLGTIGNLEFDVLECEESKYNTDVVVALKEHIENKYYLSDILVTIIRKLLRDKKLMVDLYGINYEGYSYKIENNNVCQGSYDLLAYTIHSDDIISLMDINN